MERTSPYYKRARVEVARSRSQIEELLLDPEIGGALQVGWIDLGNGLFGVEFAHKLEIEGRERIGVFYIQPTLIYRRTNIGGSRIKVPAPEQSMRFPAHLIEKKLKTISTGAITFEQEFSSYLLHRVGDDLIMTTEEMISKGVIGRVAQIRPLIIEQGEPLPRLPLGPHLLPLGRG